MSLPIKSAAQLSLDMESVIAWLVGHGMPDSIADDLKLMEGRAKDIVWMVITDGKDAAIAFVQAEKDKILDALMKVQLPSVVTSKP